MAQNDIGGCIISLRPMVYSKLQKLEKFNERKDKKKIKEVLKNFLPVYIEEDGTATVEARIEVLKQRRLIGFTLRNLKNHKHFTVVNHPIEFPEKSYDILKRARIIHFYQDFFPVRFALALILVAEENGWNINIQPLQPNSPRMVLKIKGLNLDDIKGLTKEERKERNYEKLNPKILAHITKLLRAKIRKV